MQRLKARPDDGLPETLEEVVAAYGHHYFKLKLSGDPEAIRPPGDCSRARPRSATTRSTLDGNEQYDDVEAVMGCGAAWRRRRACAAEGRDPVRRAADRARPGAREPVTRWPASAAGDRRVGCRLRRLPARAALGYRGISSKSCKGFYRALLNRARVEAGTPKEAGAFHVGRRPHHAGGVAVQQDLALATLVGITHIERNGHHYVDGMAGAPQTSRPLPRRPSRTLSRRAGRPRPARYPQRRAVARARFPGAPALPSA